LTFFGEVLMDFDGLKELREEIQWNGRTVRRENRSKKIRKRHKFSPLSVFEESNLLRS
jgi:hypothetical protein